MNLLPQIFRNERPVPVNGLAVDDLDLGEPGPQEGLIIQPKMGQLISHVNTSLITRAQLAEINAPEGTRTHRPVKHIDVVNAVIETLGFRKINVTRDEYAVDKTG